MTIKEYENLCEILRELQKSHNYQKELFDKAKLILDKQSALYYSKTDYDPDDYSYPYPIDFII